MFGRRIEFELAALWMFWGSFLGYSEFKLPSLAVQPAAQAEVASSNATATTEAYADSVGTGNRIEILPETPDASSDSYLHYLLTQLKKSWLAFIPDGARNGAPAKVTAAFEILPDGKLPKGDPRIESGSGIPSLDNAAIYAIRYWRKFDPLPARFQGPTLKLRINFLYNVQTTAPIEIARTASTQTSQSSGDSGGAFEGGYGVTILSNTYGVDFGPYAKRMLSRLRANWYAVMPGEANLGEKGKTSVLFTILPDGSSSTVGSTIEEGSGHEELDKAALAAVNDSLPFEPLPSQFHGPYVKLRVIFLYNIKPDSQSLQPPVGKE